MLQAPIKVRLFDQGKDLGALAHGAQVQPEPHQFWIDARPSGTPILRPNDLRFRTGFHPGSFLGLLRTSDSQTIPIFIPTIANRSRKRLTGRQLRWPHANAQEMSGRTSTWLSADRTAEPI